MTKIIKLVKGTHDYLGKDIYLLNYLIKTCKNVLKKYCYNEIITPIIEQTKLFKLSIGNNTDIIDKEMYSFLDKHKNEITLRPEGTSGCIRLIIEKNLLYNNKIQKLWYFGPMFRYENTQKGRYRQFNQLGVEVIGIKSIYIEVEIILITIKIWKSIGILKNLRLEINSIGSLKDRFKYKKKLNHYLKNKKKIINKYYNKNYKKNPFRLLESNNLYIKKILKKAPSLYDYLNKKSLLKFKELCKILNKFKIKFHINKNLIRGLNYYNDTVFEWKNNKINSQSTICAGGRYDNLISMLGGKNSYSFGFAIGIERLMILIKSLKEKKVKKRLIDIEIIFLEKEAILKSINLSEKVRKIFPKLKILVNFCNEKLKKKLSKSSKNNVKVVLIIGKNEIKNKFFTFKNLEKNKQKEYSYKKLIKKISNTFKYKK
ncbi:histidine--tRNA ligase [Buchnera aphidicola (Ceratoglyphina bambusae)]|uniref:histidine--tRNA ligase n=1 Tax=Buchnera aphidicola TaxID=9 RepID=UPI0031B7FF7F